MVGRTEIPRGDHLLEPGLHRLYHGVNERRFGAGSIQVTRRRRYGLLFQQAIIGQRIGFRLLKSGIRILRQGISVRQFGGGLRDRSGCRRLPGRRRSDRGKLIRAAAIILPGGLNALRGTVRKRLIRLRRRNIRNRNRRRKKSSSTAKRKSRRIPPTPRTCSRWRNIARRPSSAK